MAEWKLPRALSLSPLQIKYLVKPGHFDLRFGKLRRELLHRSFLPVGEERARRARVSMPFQ